MNFNYTIDTIQLMNFFCKMISFQIESLSKGEIYNHQLRSLHPTGKHDITTKKLVALCFFMFDEFFRLNDTFLN